MSIKKIKLPDNTTQNINDSRISDSDITKWNSSSSQSTLIVHITEKEEEPGSYESDTPFADILAAYNEGRSIYAEIEYSGNTIRVPLLATNGTSLISFVATSHSSSSQGGEYAEGIILISADDSVALLLSNDSLVLSVPSLPVSGADYSANCSFLVTSGATAGHIFKWSTDEWVDITPSGGGSSTLVVHITYGDNGYESDTNHSDILAAYLAGKSIYAVAPTVYDFETIMQLSARASGTETEDMPFVFTAFGTNYENGDGRGQINWGELYIYSDDSVEYSWGARHFVISPAYLPDDGSLYSHDTLFIPTHDDEDGHLAGHLYQWHNSAWIDITPSGGGGGIAEAPTDGRVYGRRGSDNSWQAVNDIVVVPIRVDVESETGYSVDEEHLSKPISRILSETTDKTIFVITNAEGSFITGLPMTAVPEMQQSVGIVAYGSNLHSFSTSADPTKYNFFPFTITLYFTSGNAQVLYARDDALAISTRTVQVDTQQQYLFSAEEKARARTNIDAAHNFNIGKGLKMTTSQLGDDTLSVKEMAKIVTLSSQRITLEANTTVKVDLTSASGNIEFRGITSSDEEAYTYKVLLVIGATVPTFSWYGVSILWENGQAPTTSASSTIEIIVKSFNGTYIGSFKNYTLIQ